jgi:hypothetical protein
MPISEGYAKWNWDRFLHELTRQGYKIVKMEDPTISQAYKKGRPRKPGPEDDDKDQEEG